MKEFIFALATSLVLVSFSSHAQTDGPFGLVIGSPVEQFDCMESGTDSIYRCTPSNPHPAFEIYAVKASSSHGICWIKAIGTDISDNGRGTNTKSKTDEIAAQVASVYGNWTDNFDFLSVGSIWDESDEWLMGMVQNDRYYGFTWGVEDGYEPQKNVVSVYVGADATRSNVGYVVAEFSGSNLAECEEEIAAKQSSVF